MKRIIISVAVAVIALPSASGQKVKKYSEIVYVNSQVENDDVAVSIVSAVGMDKELKFKLKIVNKTNDYVLFKPQETKFVANGNTTKPTEKEMVIGPLENDSKVINITGAFNSTLKGEYIIDGFYKVSSKSNSVKTEDFKLPLVKSDFSTGGFNVASTKVVKQSDATKLKFSASYTGDKMGCIFTGKATVLMPDGNEYLCDKSSGMFSQPGMIMIKKGKTESFDLAFSRQVGGKAMDMQKVPMILKWNDTFSEVNPELEATITVPFEINNELSK